MTGKNGLDNLRDALVDDIMAMSDEEIMAEILEELGSQEAVDAEILRVSQIVNSAIAEALETPEERDEEVKR